jgi:hypothetical protein
MAQAVSRRPLTTEVRVSPCGICGGQSGTATGFPLSVSFHRGSITRKKKKKLIIFITGWHNKPQGCSASVASAAGPFTTKKKKKTNTNYIHEELKSRLNSGNACICGTHWQLKAQRDTHEEGKCT